MGRKHIEINPECGRRLAGLLAENGMKQIELAGKLGYDAQHISNIVRGKRNLTLDTAQRIVREIFPGVLVEWLLEISDFKTQEEKDAYSEKMWEENHKAALLYDKAFRCFIDGIEDLCGYGLHSQSTDVLIGDYIAVTDTTGKKVGAIPAESFDRLKHEIENFASYSLNLLIKNEMLSLPNSITGGENNG